MSVSRGDLGVLLQFLGDGVHGVDLPARLGEDRVDHSRSNNDIGLEGHDELQLGKVGVWAGNLGAGRQELEVGSCGGNEKIGGSLQNCWLKVESAVVPGEG